MAFQGSDDPFLSVQSDVLTTLTSTRHLFSSYLRIRTLSPNPTSPELIQSRSDLQSNLETLTADLADLLDSVQAVESDPYKFGLDVAEVQRRRGFVKDVGDEVEGMRRELVGVVGDTHIAGPATFTTTTNTSNEAGRAGGKLPAPASFEDEDREEDDDPYGEFAQQQQEVMMREQDEQLDGVFQSVGVLRGQAVDMGRELEEQGVLLDDVDTLADRVGGKLQVGVKKVGEVIRRNEDSVYVAADMARASQWHTRPTPTQSTGGQLSLAWTPTVILDAKPKEVVELHCYHTEHG